ncbi:MAG TPA: 4Fe-4S binding protein [Negativicutes bacterium]|jgi:Fe-S-cluster-containing dehydrogenase component
MSISKERYGLLIDYEFCTGCHSCETACKVEQNLPVGQWGIKLAQDGPRKLENGRWEYAYLPIPTSLCDLCEKRLAAGKQPTCVQHCQAGVMSFGAVEELAKKMADKPKTVLFAPQ